jgi:hypothetical protein
MLFRKRKENSSGSEETFVREPAPADPGIPGSLVAAIAAAIAAEAGLSPGTFRIASISPAACDSGFNTPIWGRVERLFRA